MANTSSLTSLDDLFPLLDEATRHKQHTVTASADLSLALSQLLSLAVGGTNHGHDADSRILPPLENTDGQGYVQVYTVPSGEGICDCVDVVVAIRAEPVRPAVFISRLVSMLKQGVRHICDNASGTLPVLADCDTCPRPLRCHVGPLETVR